MLMERGAAHGIYGARLNGSGVGGTVAVLLEDSSRARQEMEGILERYRQETGLAAAVLAGSSPGAGEAAPLRVLVKNLSA
jgi:galactokinase